MRGADTLMRGANDVTEENDDVTEENNDVTEENDDVTEENDDVSEVYIVATNKTLACAMPSTLRDQRGSLINEYFVFRFQKRTHLVVRGAVDFKDRGCFQCGHHLSR